MVRARFLQGQEPTFKPGDSVTIKMNPLHDGRPGGEYITISKDGKEFGRGAEP